MKTTKETRSRITDLIRTYLGARFPLILDAIKADPDKTSRSELWVIWNHITDEIRFDDSHPRFEGRTRVLPHDFDFPLYPDGTNDSTLETALRSAVKSL